MEGFHQLFGKGSRYSVCRLGNVLKIKSKVLTLPQHSVQTNAENRGKVIVTANFTGKKRLFPPHTCRLQRTSGQNMSTKGVKSTNN